MIPKAFRKVLSANDLGMTGGHQAGIMIPKGDNELLCFLPSLDASVKNPDAWITCRDDAGDRHKFRFVYYNNKLHDKSGTRNEYRLTHMTAWLRKQNASPGDNFEIGHDVGHSEYQIRIIRSEENSEPELESKVHRLRLKGWRSVH